MAGLNKGVFLSYASQDAEAARHICEALRASGIEVWFDQNELRGGDTWDRQIRKQISDCALFIPIISSHSQGRLEGYFRREWKLAADRTHDMAEEKAFIVPVVIDATSERDASVPEKFREVQWSRLAAGQTPPAFVERISRLLSPALSNASLQAHSPLGVTAASRQCPPSVATKVRRRAVLLLLIGPFVIIGGVYLALDKFGLSKRIATTHTSGVAVSDPQGVTEADPEKSIAVLPFVDMSERHDQEYFGDGMAEEILNLLSTIPDLRVIARTSSFRFEGKADDLRDIGQVLGASYILQGSVRRSENHVRVTAQLIDARNGTHRWSDTYDREVKDVLTVQTEIATGLVRALQLEITSSAYFKSRAPLRNSDAYEAYLRGLHAINKFNQRGFEDAVFEFTHALELDRSFVPAAENLALARALQADWGYVELKEGWESARAAAKSALAIESNSALAHAVLGLVHTKYDWDWPAAEVEFNSAVALAPTNPLVLTSFSLEREAVGKSTEAAHLLDTAIRADPLNAVSYLCRGWAYIGLGRLLEAEQDFRRVLEISPSYAWGHYYLGVSLLVDQKYDLALTEMLKETDAQARNAGLAVVYYALRRPKDSDAALKTLEGVDESVDAWWLGAARARAFRAQKDQALQFLEKTYAERGGDLYLIKTDPFMKNLEGDTRYKAILFKMNLPE